MCNAGIGYFSVWYQSNKEQVRAAVLRRHSLLLAVYQLHYLSMGQCIPVPSRTLRLQARLRLLLHGYVGYHSEFEEPFRCLCNPDSLACCGKTAVMPQKHLSNFLEVGVYLWFGVSENLAGVQTYVHGTGMDACCAHYTMLSEPTAQNMHGCEDPTECAALPSVLLNVLRSVFISNSS